LKKCTQCNSISSDSEVSCGVCGASLSGVTSLRLEQLSHKEPEIKLKKKRSLGGLAFVSAALVMTIAGASLLFFNALGIFLMLAGLIIIMYILGGAGTGAGIAGGVGGHRSGGGKQSMLAAEAKQEEEERKRRRGEGD